MQNMLFYTAKWNCYNPLGASLKTVRSKQSNSSNITNFLIEVRWKNPYERGIRIISRRSANPPSPASSPHMNSTLNIRVNLCQKKFFMRKETKKPMHRRLVKDFLCKCHSTSRKRSLSSVHHLSKLFSVSYKKMYWRERF